MINNMADAVVFQENKLLFIKVTQLDEIICLKKKIMNRYFMLDQTKLLVVPLFCL